MSILQTNILRLVILILAISELACQDGGTNMPKYEIYVFIIQAVDSVNLAPIEYAYFGNKAVPDDKVIIGDSLIVDSVPDPGIGNFTLPEGYTDSTGRGVYFASNLPYSGTPNGIELKDFLVYKLGYKIWRYNPVVHKLIKIKNNTDSLYVRMSPK